MLRPWRSTGLIVTLSLGGRAPPSMVPCSHAEIAPATPLPARVRPVLRYCRNPVLAPYSGSYLFRVPAEGKTSIARPKILQKTSASVPLGKGTWSKGPLLLAKGYCYIGGQLIAWYRSTSEELT